ncbi:winged helix-turn-helix domain-containing protein [Dokdonella koreensis]|uniref:Integral membrane protein n=1 Tax=Dokdonella koreensis DS-123 TaxID=1300342 RepID=A0A160DW62_9GAMM|nr:winged helix-turn-helix domain-containing protein [Dokdonella koreensis]ANB18855.1 Putative integral membrane protein [Dokdonella koreensis DS-123]
MSRVCYRFGAFRLNPHARELHRSGERIALPTSHIDCLAYLIQHRDRPVGRDELTAAVWGRVDVSDVSLNHAIMRLRRQLGLSGSEQEGIRTVWGVGYRWVMDDTVVEAEDAPVAPPSPAAAEAPAPLPAAVVAVVEPAPLAAPVDAAPPALVPAVPRPASRRAWLWGLAALVALVLAGWALSLRRAPPPQTAAVPASAPASIPALVLPVQVEAPDGWAWLRLGVMDLVATQLRRGGLAVTPSEAVVGLLNPQLDVPTEDGWVRERMATPQAWVVRPRVRLAGSSWQMALQASDGHRALYADAVGEDVLHAARTATDRLLVKLGRVPPATTETSLSRVAEETAQRISAAVLAGQLDVARALIDAASPEIRGTPEIALAQANIDFFSGNYEASARGAEALLDRLSPDTAPLLRARALHTLGSTYFRQDRLEAADAAFAEGIRLVEPLGERSTLAGAYTGRGAVAGRSRRLDDAVRLFGTARMLHEQTNDAFGVARVDLNLGVVAMDRAQPAMALPILEAAAARLETLAVPEAWAFALRSIVDAQLMLLQHPAALATSERFWPPESHSRNTRERWWMTQSRAVALAANGRLTDAEALAAQIRDLSSPTDDAIVRAEADSLLASIALLRGSPETVVQHAQEALAVTLGPGNRLTMATTRLTRIRALHRLGRVAEAAEDVRYLQAQALEAPDDWRVLFIRLAEAEQAGAEGRRDAALAAYATAMSLAEATGVPENLVVVGESYVPALLAAGQREKAGAIAGRVAPWAGQDLRAALIQVAVHRALGDRAAAEHALRQARQLAGERLLPAELLGVADVTP